MVKNVRIVVIRARHDTSVATIADRACIDMLMTGSRSLMGYWSATTRGHLDFVDSSLLPWVDMTLGADTSRGAQAKAAMAAVRARYPGRDPLAGYDGIVVLSHPGTVQVPNPAAGAPGQPATVAAGIDGGTTSIGGTRIAVLPVMASDHTFMAHELGHVLGFDHSYGLPNNGADWDWNDGTDIEDPVYGSPYDLMSSASFGTRQLGTGTRYRGEPTHTGPAVAGWPFAGAFEMGPHLSRANLHRWMPDALAGRVVERPFPTGGGSVRARIFPASGTAKPALLILHPPNEPANGVGRVYLEYRIASGWDAGLDQVGPSLSREGVVAHSLVDVPNAGPRVWYRGAVPANSVDSDLAVDGTPLVVTVEAFDPERRFVDVSVRQGAQRRMTIGAGIRSDDVVGVIGIEGTDRTPCGDTIRTGTYATSTFEQFRVRTAGFGGAGEPVTAPAAVRWTVGGVAVTGTSGTVDVPYDGAVFTLDYTIDPVGFELALTSRGGERLAAELVCTVADASGSATATARFDAEGWYEGINRDDLGILGACWGKLAKQYELQVEIGPFRRPTPEPQWLDPRERHELEIEWQAGVLDVIRESPALDVAGRTAPHRLVQLQGMGRLR